MAFPAAAVAALPALGATMAGASLALGTTIVAINGVVSALKQTNKALNDFNQWQDKAQRASFALGASFETVSKDIGFSFEKLNKSISIQLQNNLDNLNYNLENNNKLSVIANTALDKTSKNSESLQTSMDGLRGSISDRLGSVFETLKVGFQGNAQGVASLINQQKLLGLSFKNTAGVFLKLENGLNLSREATNELADDTKKFSIRWGVSTDKLVDALNTITETLPYQELAGWGKNFTEAVVELQAKLGPSLEGDLTKFIKMFTDTSLEGQRKLNILGIAEYRDRMSYAKSSNESLFLLEQSIKRGRETVDTFLGRGSQVFIAAEGLSNAAGQAAISLKVLDDNIYKRVRRRTEEDWTDIISLMKKEIWNPIKALLLDEFYPIMKGFYNIIHQAQTSLVQELSNYLKENKYSLLETAKTFTLGIIDAAIAFTEAIPTIVSVIQNLTTQITNAVNLLSKHVLGIGDADTKRAAYLGITTTEQVASFMKARELYTENLEPVFSKFSSEFRNTAERYARERNATSLFAHETDLEFYDSQLRKKPRPSSMFSKDDWVYGLTRAIEEVYADDSSLRSYDRNILKGPLDGIADTSKKALLQLRRFFESLNPSILGIEKNTMATVEELRDERKTASSYLNRSNDILETAVRRVLGYDNTNNLKTLVSLTEQNVIMKRGQLDNQRNNAQLDRASSTYNYSRLR